MKKLFIGLVITLILLTGSPALAVGPHEWQKAVNDIATLQQQQAQNEALISNLTIRVEKLEQEKIALESRIGIVESLFAQLKGLLVQVVQMLLTLKR